MRSDASRLVSRRGFFAASGAAAATHVWRAFAEGLGASGQASARPRAQSSQNDKPMIRMAELIHPPEDALWRMVKQCGLDYVDGHWEGDWDKERAAGEKPWDYEPLERLKRAYENRGFKLAGLESRPPMERVKLGLPERDEEIEEVAKLIRNMGKLGIPMWCYEWMAGIPWTRTKTGIRTRGGALTSGFDVADIKDAPLTRYGVVQEETMWESLKYFLERVVPVAEESNAKLAMHPDDPPLSPIRGMPRIMRSIENYGNFTLMTDDLPSVIRHFGRQKKIFFVHFRDVEGTPEKFMETFHDAGKTDMAACMRAYRDIGYDGICRPDHVPTMEGDSNEKPGYSSIGCLFAIGYIIGLHEAVYSEERLARQSGSRLPIGNAESITRRDTGHEQH